MLDNKEGIKMTWEKLKEVITECLKGYEKNLPRITYGGKRNPNQADAVYLTGGSWQARVEVEETLEAMGVIDVVDNYPTSKRITVIQR